MGTLLDHRLMIYLKYSNLHNDNSGLAIVSNWIFTPQISILVCVISVDEQRIINANKNVKKH